MSKTTRKPVLIDNLEVCAILGVRPDTWRKRVQVGTAPLPHCRMGSRTYYRRVDVRRFLRLGRWPEGMVFRAAEAG